ADGRAVGLCPRRVWAGTGSAHGGWGPDDHPEDRAVGTGICHRQGLENRRLSGENALPENADLTPGNVSPLARLKAAPPGDPPGGFSFDATARFSRRRELSPAGDKSHPSVSNRLAVMHKPHNLGGMGRIRHAPAR